MEAKWRKWFQEERVASGGKGCYTKCERTRNRLFSSSSNMEVFGHSTKSYFGGAIGAKTLLEGIEGRMGGRK